MAAAEVASINLEDHPHCAQLRTTAEADRKPRVWDSSLRFLSPSYARMEYCKRPDKERSSNHWGQLKLCESELYALHQFPKARVIYAGAAPGKHLITLAKRFPHVQFDLYDPAEFDSTLVDFAASNGRISLVRDFFTTVHAKNIRDEDRPVPVVFICDIRTADAIAMSSSAVELAVKTDQDRQMEWAKIIEADLSLLKYRLPWGAGTTNYLDGNIFVQAYPPCTSTETRLLCTKEDLAKPLKSYDHKTYEEQLMWHNTVQRAQLFPHNVKVEGLDYCYDCRALVETMSKHIGSENCDDIKVAIETLISDINDHGRTLSTKYAVSSTRKGARFSHKRFRDADGNNHFEVAKRRT